MPSFVSLLEGRTLARRYRIERLQGRGGMGAVFAAQDLNLERTVAVKVIAIDMPDAETEAMLRARFLQEARIAGKLGHPGLVTVHELGIDKKTGMDFIVMEMLSGEDLQTRLKKGESDDPAFVLEVVLQAADALGVAHAERLIHRDIKPSNLFIEPARVVRVEGDLQVPRVRVLDFGIARVHRADGVNLTRSAHGPAPLTLAYAAPEQLQGKMDVTPACDVFSLAVTAYEMLVGELPFSPVERGRLARGSTVRPASFPRTVEVPEPLAEVLLKALAHSPAERFADATAFAEALRGARKAIAEAREARERTQARGHQNSEQVAEVDQLRFHLGALQQVARALAVVRPLEETERLVLDSVAEVFFAWWAALYHAEGEQYTCRAVRSPRGESVAIAIPARVVRAVAMPGQPPVVPPENAEIRDHVPAEIGVVAPLDFGGGDAGLLILGRRMNEAPYEVHDLALLRALSDASAIALRNAELLDRLRAQATIDPLTGCYDRRGYDEIAALEFARARRYKRPLSFLLVTVEHLEQINERFGYQVGDHVLQRIGRAVRHTFRNTDSACRYGGGDFVLIMPETTADEVTRFAERIRVLCETLPPNAEVPVAVTVRVRTVTDPDTVSIPEIWLAAR